MAAISYFPAYDQPEEIANVKGSMFGEPDGTIHRVEVLDGEGSLIVRVQLQSSDEPVDLLFDRKRALAFSAGVEAVLERMP